MEDKVKKTSTAEKALKGGQTPKAKPAKRAPKKKEYVVVLVKQSVVIVSLDGHNTRVAKTGALKNVSSGDKVML